MDLMSTAQLLGNFGEFFGAVAVVATLIFVGIQVRQSTAASRLSGSQAAMHSWITVSLATVNSEPLRRAHYTGLYPELKAAVSDDDDYAIMTAFLNAGIKAVESNYLQWRAGNLSDELWHGYRATLTMSFTLNRYFNQFWDFSRLNYSPEFRAVVDEIRQEATARREHFATHGTWPDESGYLGR